MVSLLIAGTARRVYIYGDLEKFKNWLSRLQKPSASVLVGAMKEICELDMTCLQVMRALWKFERDTEPPVYVVRKGHARLYCCLKSGDIVVLDWTIKKRRKADRRVLERAQRLAKELEGIEKLEF
jgi:hypothetical protein